MEDICANNHRGNQESTEAFANVAPRAATLRTRVVEYMKSHPEGVIVEEAEHVLGLRNQSASPRMSELKKMKVAAPKED